MLVLGFSLALAIVLLLCQGELALSGVVPAPGATRRRIGKGPGSANVFEPQEGPLQSFGRTQPHNHPPVSWFLRRGRRAPGNGCQSRSLCPGRRIRPDAKDLMFTSSPFILPYEPGYTGHWE